MNESDLPQRVRDQLAEAREMIAKGEIKGRMTTIRIGEDGEPSVTRHGNGTAILHSGQPLRFMPEGDVN